MRNLAPALGEPGRWVMFAVYGWLVHAWPVLAVNTLIAFVNVFFLRQMAQRHHLVQPPRRKRRETAASSPGSSPSIKRMSPASSRTSTGAPSNRPRPLVFSLRDYHPGRAFRLSD